MAGWSGRQASTRLRILVLLALGTIFLSAHILLRAPAPSTESFLDDAHDHSLDSTTPLDGSDAEENSSPAYDEPAEERLPPLYPELKAAELTLPQHDEDLPFPEGKYAKFLRVGNQMWGVGLNNQLSEILLNTEIARRSGRAYVFTPFIWDAFAAEDAYVPISPGSNHLAGSTQTVRAAKIPLRAFFHSPTSGEPWPVGYDPKLPRAISDKWYDRMCPEEKRVQIDPSVVNKEIGVDVDEDEGIDIVDKWAKYLRDLDAPCANIQWSTPRIIDFNLLGSERILSLWPTFSTSPVLTAFKWSPIVLGAVARNFERLGITSLQKQAPADSPIDPKDESYIPGLVTIHVRRKDYYGHCHWMSGWAEFEAWNRLPFLPDGFVAPGPPHGPWPNGTARIDPSVDPRAQYMIPRCWVEIADIVKKVRDVRRDFLEQAFKEEAGKGNGVRLDKVYISTNEDREWVDRLEEALRRDGGGEWKEIASTPDTELTWEESGVDSAIDMEMASRGELFIGNGFSTFTSTIVSLRLSRGLPGKNIRFW